MPPIRINYKEEIRIRSDAKKTKSYKISEVIIALYYSKLLGNFLGMITQVL